MKNKSIRGIKSVDITKLNPSLTSDWDFEYYNPKEDPAMKDFMDRIRTIAEPPTHMFMTPINPFPKFPREMLLGVKNDGRTITMDIETSHVDGLFSFMKEEYNAEFIAKQKHNTELFKREVLGEWVEPDEAIIKKIRR